LQNLTFDRLSAISYGCLPTVTNLCLHLHCLIIFLCKQVKAGRSRKLVAKNLHTSETFVLVGNILISAWCMMEGADNLKSAGLDVHDIVVFIDY